MLAEALTCMALAVYLEARGEPLLGQYAVAHVVKNRAEDPAFPDDPCGVVWDGVYDQNGRIRKHKCQFSALCDGKPENTDDPQAWSQAYIVAGLVAFGLVPDITGGARWYIRAGERASWARGDFLQIGRHKFYVSLTP